MIGRGRERERDREPSSSRVTFPVINDSRHRRSRHTTTRARALRGIVTVTSVDCPLRLFLRTYIYTIRYGAEWSCDHNHHDRHDLPLLSLSLSVSAVITGQRTGDFFCLSWEIVRSGPLGLSLGSGGFVCGSYSSHHSMQLVRMIQCV